MNNIKVIFYNVETVDSNAFESALISNNNYISHIVLKPGFYFVNFQGSAKDLFDALGVVIQEKSIIIHDLDSDNNAFWGYWNRNVWDWLRNNRS